MDTKELESLKECLVKELVDVIENLSADGETYVGGDIQPPESIIQLAAEAAASVLMAFERGYRMD